MSTIKTDRIDFEKLLNGVDPVGQSAVSEQSSPTQPATQTVIDNTTAAETLQQRMFMFNSEQQKKGLRKKARKTILNVVKHIIPGDIIEEEYIQDKIEQDIETMAALYLQLETNTVMQQSIVEMVSTGNAAPRMYEVFGQLTDKIQSINKQIFDTEQRIRKTYVDIKYEIRDKMSEDFSVGISGPGQQNMIESNGNGTVVTSTRNLIAGARKKHIEKINNENISNVKEAEFEVKE